MTDLSKEARDAILRLLQELLGPHGYRGATIEAREDHDGDPAIYIEAHFELVPTPLDVSVTFGVTGALREALAKFGEFRFPYVEYDFHDDQQVAPRKRRKRA